MIRGFSKPLTHPPRHGLVARGASIELKGTEGFASMALEVRERFLVQQGANFQTTAWTMWDIQQNLGETISNPYRLNYLCPGAFYPQAFP
jgi:hypothetical protein